MTEAEINLAIAKIEYPDESVSHLNDLDYCKYWSDIGPIIERNEMRLDSLGNNQWEATLFEDDGTGYFDAKWYAHAETPMKAAALCYLKMKESEAVLQELADQGQELGLE